MFVYLSHRAMLSRAFNDAIQARMEDLDERKADALIHNDHDEVGGCCNKPDYVQWIHKIHIYI